MAPLWHWDLTDHHCGIIVPFQPHEQKQGPEPPAVGTRGQRDTPMGPSPPPPVVPEVIWGTPMSVGAGCGAVPVPFPGKAAVFFGQTPTAPHHPMGLRCSWGAGGTRSPWGEVCTSARAPPLPSSSSSSPPKLSHLEAAEIWGHPNATSAVPLTPGAGGRGAGGAGGGLSSQLPPPGSRIRPSCAAATPQLSQPKAWVTSALGPEGNQKAHIWGGGTFLLQAALPQGAAPTSLPQGPGQKEGGTKQPPPPGKGKALGSCSPLAPLPLLGGGSRSPQGHPLHGAEPQQSCPKVWGGKILEKSSPPPNTPATPPAAPRGSAALGGLRGGCLKPSLSDKESSTQNSWQTPPPGDSSLGLIPPIPELTFQSY